MSAVATAPATFYTIVHGTSTAYIKGRCRCDECRRWNREHARDYVAANRPRINEQRRTRYADDPDKYNRLPRRNRAILSRYKLLVGCLKCGFRAHPAALQFHHRDPQDKAFAIAPSSSRAWAKLKAEVRKCDVLCANCHAIVEAGRGGDAT